MTRAASVAVECHGLTGEARRSYGMATARLGEMSVLAQSAWARVAVVAAVLVILWLTVDWAVAVP